VTCELTPSDLLKFTLYMKDADAKHPVAVLMGASSTGTAVSSLCLGTAFLPILHHNYTAQPYSATVEYDYNAGVDMDLDTTDAGCVVVGIYV
jgi:hypothetical protein